MLVDILTRGGRSIVGAPLSSSLKFEKKERLVQREQAGRGGDDDCREDSHRKILYDINGVSVINFGQKDIVRDEMVTKIINAYDSYDNQIKDLFDQKN